MISVTLIGYIMGDIYDISDTDWLYHGRYIVISVTLIGYIMGDIYDISDTDWLYHGGYI